MNWLGTGEPMTDSTPCRLEAKPNSSAASVARIGSHLPKIDRGQRDVARAAGHLPVELRDRDQGVERATHAGDRARRSGSCAAGAVDLDADGVGGLGVLADRAHPQAPPGAVERRRSRRPRRRTAGRRSPSGGRRSGRSAGCRRAPGSAPRRSAAGVFSDGGVGREHLAEHEAGQPDHQHVEHDADDHLVDEVVDREAARAARPPACRRPSRRRAPPRSSRRPEATSAAANAPASSWPSMAMLTTPARSPRTPPSAPKTRGTASATEPASRPTIGIVAPAAAQVRKPIIHATAKSDDQPQRGVAPGEVQAHRPAGAAPRRRGPSARRSACAGTVISGARRSRCRGRAGRWCRPTRAGQPHDQGEAQGEDGEEHRGLAVDDGPTSGRTGSPRRDAGLAGRGCSLRLLGGKSEDRPDQRRRRDEQDDQ